MDVYRSSLDQGGNPPPSVAACRAEVQRLIAFRDFAAAPQMRNFLEYIVEETLAQRGDQLKERNIAVHALMRDTAFDPRLDCIVRVMAGKLRRALECHYQGIDGASAAVRIEVPRGTYRPVFRRIELTSWEAASSHATISAQRSPATGSRPVLAVLPLLPLTEGREELALAEALACEVCVRLRQLSWLELLDYLVTRRWQNDPHGSAVEEMHCCDYVVGGTCRRQAGQFRVTVQLTNVCDGHLLWADQFDLFASMENFAAEDAIVTRICDSISQSLRAAVPIGNLQRAQRRAARRGVQSGAKSSAIVKTLPP